MSKEATFKGMVHLGPAAVPRGTGELVKEAPVDYCVGADLRGCKLAHHYIQLRERAPDSKSANNVYVLKCASSLQLSS